MNRLLAAKTGISMRASGWKLAGGAWAAAVVVVLVCYWQTVQSLLWVWAHDGTYQYAFLIFPLSVLTAFNLRHRLAAASPKPSVWGLPALVVLVFVWYAGHSLDINLPQHVALVALFPALVLVFWGWRALRVLVFPLGYLVFAVPWGDALVGPLQDITAHFAVRTLELTGTPVLLNGREIITPSAVWMVADACSGVKFFIACTALGCLYAYLMYRHWWKRVLFVALAAIVPVIANGFRVYFTVLIGDTWGLHYATGTDHMVFGWQFFGTVLLLLLLAGWFFRDRVGVQNSTLPSDNRFTGGRIAVWLPAIVLLILGPVMGAAMKASPAPLKKLMLTAPVVAGWLGSPLVTSDWHPVFNGATAEIQATYQTTSGDDSVGLFHAVYTGKPRRGHNLITYGNNVYDTVHARILSSTSQHIKLADGQRLVVGELRLAGADGSRLVWYWYCVDRRCTDSPVLIKLMQALSALRGEVPQSAVWALSSSIANGDLDRTRSNLRAFARVLSLTSVAHRQLHASSDADGDAS